MINSIIFPLWGCCDQLKGAAQSAHVFCHVPVSYVLWRGLSVLRWRSCSWRPKVKGETILVQGLNLRTDKGGFFLLSTFNVSWFCSLKTTYHTLDNWTCSILHLISLNKRPDSKKQILFTHFHVVPNPHDFFLLWKTKEDISHCSFPYNQNI